MEFKLEKFENINYKENIITKIKQKITNYIKEKKENNSTNIENILLEGKNFYLLYNNNLINDEKIKKLCSIISKVEIKKVNFDNINDNIFMNVYEILSPSYKALLAQNYINEMPQNFLFFLIDLLVSFWVSLLSTFSFGMESISWFSSLFSSMICSIYFY